MSQPVIIQTQIEQIKSFLKNNIPSMTEEEKNLLQKIKNCFEELRIVNKKDDPYTRTEASKKEDRRIIDIEKKLIYVGTLADSLGVEYSYLKKEVEKIYLLHKSAIQSSLVFK